MNTEDENIGYFNASGEYLEDLFKLSDFLTEPTTRQILEDNHNELFEKHIEPKIEELYNYIKSHISDKTRLLHRDNRGIFLSKLLNIIYYSVNKNYDLEIFYNNPELASNLVANYKNNIKK